MSEDCDFKAYASESESAIANFLTSLVLYLQELCHVALCGDHYSNVGFPGAWVNEKAHQAFSRSSILLAKHFLAAAWRACW